MTNISSINQPESKSVATMRMQIAHPIIAVRVVRPLINDIVIPTDAATYVASTETTALVPEAGALSRFLLPDLGFSV